MHPVAPPAGTDKCQCPYCRTVMAIPAETQRLLLQQREEAERARLAQQRDADEERQYREELTLPDLPESEQQRCWLKRIVAEENVLQWHRKMAGGSNRKLDTGGAEGGGDTKGSASGMEEGAKDELLAEAWVRELKDGKLTWKSAAEGFQLVMPLTAAPAKPAPEYLKQLESVSDMTFQKKRSWFLEVMKQMAVPWEQGHVKMVVSRENLLADSYAQMNKLTRQQMRQTFRFTFNGEEAIDAGGVAREWFLLTSQALFNVDFGMFK
jgi:hypothetical protein